MKNEFKLNKVVFNIKDTIKDIEERTGDRVMVNKLKTAIDQIKEFLVDNAPTPKGMKNIFDFADKDDLRPIMCGVFYDAENKMAVASDGKHLVTSADDYKEELSGKVVDKYGKEIEGQFPNYALVMEEPRTLPDKDDTIVSEYDEEKVTTILKQLAAEKKMNGDTNNKRAVYYAYIRIGNDWLKADRIKMVCDFIGKDGKIYTSPQSYRASYFKSADGKREAILMPCQSPEVNDDALLEQMNKSGVAMYCNGEWKTMTI
jgi:hypothetical protein